MEEFMVVVGNQSGANIVGGDTQSGGAVSYENFFVIQNGFQLWTFLIGFLPQA
jgi:hypothetical protein